MDGVHTSTPSVGASNNGGERSFKDPDDFTGKGRIHQ